MNTFQNVGDVAATLVNRWAWYQTALSDPSKIGGKDLPVHDGEPQQGYYRVRRKGEPWEPVAIFYPEGADNLVAYRSGQEVRPDDIWTWCCRNPITFDAYEKAMAGDGFEDEPPAPTIGDNSGDTDPFEALKIELAGEVEQLTDFMRNPVKTQADADRCGIWAKRCTDLAKRINNLRETVKAPHLSKCREIDGEFKPVEAEAKDWATKAKRHVEPFLIEQKRKRDEEARKAREEAEKQRQAALEAENEEAKAEALKAAQEAERAAETKNASAGRTGARVSVRVEKVAVVTDYAKAASALVEMKHKDLIDMIDKLAQRAAKSGMAFDGMEIKEVEKVV